MNSQEQLKNMIQQISLDFTTYPCIIYVGFELGGSILYLVA